MTNCNFYTVHGEKDLLGSGVKVYLSMPDVITGEIKAYCNECNAQFEISLKIFNPSDENKNK